MRRRARALRLLGVPVLGFCADLLIGAGCVASVESSAVSLGEAGAAPRFTEAAESGALRVIDATCPMVHSGLQASEKGVPFMPLRGVLGSDLMARRADWKVIQNPLSTQPDPIVLASAIEPEVALFHARWADRCGNVWIGRRRELATIAHAARRTCVTYEALREGDMLEDELLAPGVLASVYVSALAPAARGAWPLGMADLYAIDDAHLMQYAKDARTREGFERYLNDFVWQAGPGKSSSPAASRA
ncbi:MAG: CoA synthetase [Betaproteobacteria bacterium RIFCSPLOWO2_02_FULL_68_150]|nr:MAG: CoA synthetase [Betaproteobacteria bacterium RIFCSPLOWO2_02_FULL_68_150]